MSYWIGKLPTSPAVTGILNELNMAMNVRSLTAAHNTFLNTVFIDSQALLGDVGEYVSAESDDACNFDMLSVFKDVLSALSVVPEIGGVFTVFGAVVGLLEVGVGGGLSDISVEYNVLWNSLLTNYNNAVAANTQMATIFLTDYNKMMGVNNLILQQVVSWPIDNQLAIDMATNRYVINLYKVLLPLHWWPTYSYNTFNENTLDGCGNTVWMQYGGWGCVQQNQDYVPYWLTFGGLWWADLTNCENMLANVGVSIEDLTMGTGLWGSEIWAWNRGQNALGQDQEPSCVAKN